MNKIFRYSKGILLLEAAIALIVISISMGGMLLLLHLPHKTQASLVTARHQEALIASLKRYYTQEGYLPCPSQPNLNDGFALERCRGPKEQIGIIPYKTLGISASLIKDGYGNAFTYAVSEAATLKQSNLHTVELGNDVVILDQDGRKYGRGQQGTAFVLISHGLHGSGAFTLARERDRRPVITDFERENAADSLSFYVDLPKTLSAHTASFLPLADLISLAPKPHSHPLPETAVSESNPYATTDE